MKKLVLTISASLLLVIGAMAQADLSFDSTWVSDGFGLTNPEGWASFNAATFAGMAQTVFKDSLSPAPAFGVAAAKVITEKTPTIVMVPNPFRHGQNFDTVGLLCLGTINLGTASLSFGEPISISRPSYLSFYSKDSVVAGDSSFVLAYLTKWGAAPHPGKLDTIASGKWGETGNSSGWASHAITMTYDPQYANTIVPDSQQIFVSSSIYSHGGAKIGSKYYVDQFCWDCTAGINELHDNASISVYPNPASDVVTFSSTVNANYVEVYDITSRKFGMYPMQNNKVQIQTETFPPGLYIYDVLNAQKEVISRGKFEVAK